MKSLYRYIYSVPSLVIAILIYFILGLPLPLKFNFDTLAPFFGESLGRLVSPLVIVLALSGFFKWSGKQKALHMFVIGWIVQIINKPNSTLVSDISIAAIFIIILQIISRFFRRKKFSIENKA